MYLLPPTLCLVGLSLFFLGGTARYTCMYDGNNDGDSAAAAHTYKHTYTYIHIHTSVEILFLCEQ